MYNSQYYTCEQIDQRLLQGYLDDYNTQNNTNLTKAQFLQQLATIMGKSIIVDNLVAQIGYYICNTAAGTAAKVITAANYELTQGGSLKVKFTAKNTAKGVTLNINNKGAKTLYYQGEVVSSSNTWEANEVCEIYYDGEAYYANNINGGNGDGIYDVSANNLIEGQPTSYTSLTAALAAVPVNVQKGGMSIKYQQLTPATYSVVKTEGVETLPTGTEVDSALSITDGEYTAAQLSEVATLPSAVGSSVTYFLAVEETVESETVTTYTTWKITMESSDGVKYVQYRLMATSWSTALANWECVGHIPILSLEDIYKQYNIVYPSGTTFYVSTHDDGVCDAYIIANGTNVLPKCPFYFVGKEKKVTFLGSRYEGGVTQPKWTIIRNTDGTIQKRTSGTDIRVRIFDVEDYEGCLFLLNYREGSNGPNGGYAFYKKVYAIDEETQQETEELVPYADYDFSNADNVLAHAIRYSNNGNVSCYVKVPSNVKYLGLAYYNGSGGNCQVDNVEPVSVLDRVEQSEENIKVLQGDTSILKGDVANLKTRTMELDDIDKASNANGVPAAGHIIMLSANGEYKYFVVGDGENTINNLIVHPIDDLIYTRVKGYTTGSEKYFNYSRITVGTGVVYKYGSGTNNYVRIFEVSEYIGQVIRVRHRYAGSSVGVSLGYSLFKNLGDDVAVADYDFSDVENVISFGRKVTSSSYSFVYIPENAKYIALTEYNGDGGRESEICTITSKSDEVDGIKGVISDLDTRLNEVEGSAITDSPYFRNRDKEVLLVNACRLDFKADNRKDFQLCLINDTHGNRQSIKNAVNMTEGFSTIDAIIHNGDWEPSYYLTQNDVGVGILAACSKPAFPVIGNHDGGNKASLNATATQAQLYNRYMQPFIESGHLTIGTDIQDGKNYYFKDFPSRSVRLIVLNDYDGDDNSFNETYWKPIVYDSTLPKCTKGHAYSIGDKVNCGHNTEYSFECVQAVTPTGDPSGSPAGYPQYSYSRGSVCFRQAQLEWLAQTLLSTPANYGVIIAGHWLPGGTFNVVKCSFSLNTTSASGSSLCKVEVDNAGTIEQRDAVVELVEAFRNRSAFSKGVIYTGGAAYMNGGADHDQPAFTLTADFTQLASGVKFVCYVLGHSHSDIVFKHNLYYQYGISPICGAVGYNGSASKDVVRALTDGKAYDSLTVISANLRDNCITLVKLGVDMTYLGRLRRYMVLNVTSGTIHEWGEGIGQNPDEDPDTPDSYNIEG